MRKLLAGLIVPVIAACNTSANQESDSCLEAAQMLESCSGEVPQGFVDQCRADRSSVEEALSASCEDSSSDLFGLAGRAEGEECSWNVQCGEGLSCRPPRDSSNGGDTCQPHGTETGISEWVICGDFCHTDDDDDCAPGYECRYGAGHDRIMDREENGMCVLPGDYVDFIEGDRGEIFSCSLALASTEQFDAISQSCHEAETILAACGVSVPETFRYGCLTGMHEIDDRLFDLCGAGVHDIAPQPAGGSCNWNIECGGLTCRPVTYDFEGERTCQSLGQEVGPNGTDEVICGEYCDDDSDCAAGHQCEYGDNLSIRSTPEVAARNGMCIRPESSVDGGRSYLSSCYVVVSLAQ